MTTTIEWDKVLNGTVNQNWERLKDILFRIQRKYVPLVKRNATREVNKNSSGDEIANVNFFFYNIAHVEASAYAH